MTSTLVLLRHGQSEWNKLGLFTGWKDVPLSAQGVEEARAAGQLMLDADLKPLVLHTSLLKRAISTANLALETMDRQWLPVHRHWRLNERHYGSLQGLDKKETSAKHGKEQVFIWRRSYNVRPPALAQDDEMHPRNDPRYAKLSVDVLPSSECLADVVARMLPYFFDSVVPDLRENKTPLIVAHGNSLRALIKYLDGVSDEAITSLNIPTGIPLVYTLDHNLRCTKSRYLGDADAAKKAAEAVAHQAV